MTRKTELSKKARELSGGVEFATIGFASWFAVVCFSDALIRVQWCSPKKRGFYRFLFHFEDEISKDWILFVRFGARYVFLFGEAIFRLYIIFERK